MRSSPIRPSPTRTTFSSSSSLVTLVSFHVASIALNRLAFPSSAGVGKSCLLNRVMDNDFKEEHNVTIGVEFGSFVTKIDNKIVKLQIWDTVCACVN